MVPGPPPRAGSFQYADGTTLRVTGLMPDARNIDLQPEFGEFGHVLRIHVLQGKGIAFVEYREKDDANDALRAMDGKFVLGSIISVSLAGPPPDPRLRNRDDPPEPRAKPREDTADSARPAKEQSLQQRGGHGNQDRSKTTHSHPNNCSRSGGERSPSRSRKRRRSLSRSKSRSRSRSRSRRHSRHNHNHKRRKSASSSRSQHRGADGGTRNCNSDRRRGR